VGREEKGERSIKTPYFWLKVKPVPLCLLCIHQNIHTAAYWLAWVVIVAI